MKNDMTYEEFFAQRLAQLRYEKDVSARDMSLSIGQNPGYINSIETGKSLPSMMGFFYICDYLKVSPKDFFDDRIDSPTEFNRLVSDLKRLSITQIRSLAALIDSFSNGIPR